MKRIASLANNLSSMVVSSSASELYEELMDLPDGEVTIDLLSCNGYLNGSISLNNAYIKELSDWFLEKTHKNNIKIEEITYAKISLTIDSSTVPCDKKHIVHYLVHAKTLIEVRNKYFEQKIPETHVWHKRNSCFLARKKAFEP